MGAADGPINRFIYTCVYIVRSNKFFARPDWMRPSRSIAIRLRKRIQFERLLHLRAPRESNCNRNGIMIAHLSLQSFNIINIVAPVDWRYSTYLGERVPPELPSLLGCCRVAI